MNEFTPLERVRAYYRDLNTGDVEKVARHFKPNANHFALHVDDVAEARKALEERGVSFIGDTFDTGVCHMAFFNDPDGNALLLHHRYAPRQSEA